MLSYKRFEMVRLKVLKGKRPRVELSNVGRRMDMGYVDGWMVKLLWSHRGKFKVATCAIILCREK